MRTLLICMVAVKGILLAAACFSAAAAEWVYHEPEPGFITAPMFGKPALWLKDGSVDPTVTVDFSAAGIDLPAASRITWKVMLQKANGPVRFSVEVPVDRAEGVWPEFLLHLSLPAALPVDLFDLCATAYGSQESFACCQPNAVKIIDTIKTDYCIVHVTDIHVDDPRGCLRNCAETAAYGVIRNMIHMVNLLDPEFAVITGDHVFGTAYGREYAHLYALLQEFDVPVFLSIGNHDAINHAYWSDAGTVDGSEVFQLLFAPLTYSTSYGGLQYISLNSTDWSRYDRRGIGILCLAVGGQIRDSQLDWLEETLSATDADTVIIGMHHPPHNSFQGTGSETVMKLARQHNVAAVLAGHTHGEEICFDGDVMYVTTASTMFSGLEGSYPAVRILELSQNRLVSWNYQDPHWSVPIYKDSYPRVPLRGLDTPSLSCSFSPDNNGLNTTVTATITNHLDSDYSRLSIEFAMPLPGQGSSYRLTGGEVVDIYEKNAVQIWYVQTSVGGRSSRTVRLAATKN